MLAHERIRNVRRELEASRSGLRPDVAREISIAITSLEDAEMRVIRAFVRQSRHQADASNAVEPSVMADKLLDPTVGTEEETGTQEVTA